MLTILFILTALQYALATMLHDVTYFGRYDFSGKSPAADWSGSKLSFFVETSSKITTVSLTAVTAGQIESYQYFVGVEINCEEIGKYEVNSESNVLEFSFDSVVGKVYEVSVTKLTEASLGAMSFSEELSSVNGNIQSSEGRQSCHFRKYSMLVVGDSITAAYGVEGEYPCSFSADTENIQYSYAMLVGERVGASVHTIAWSGKGVVRNYGDENTTSADPMPLFYNRTLGISSDPNLVWDPSLYIPDVVLVTLGSNDYSTDPHPSDKDFTDGYIDLLARIQCDYPLAKVGAVCEPVPGDHECENVKTAADAMRVTYIEVPDSIYVKPDGCDYHPSIDAQQNIADVVAPAVQAMLYL